MFKPLGQQNVLLTFLLGYKSLWYVRFLTAGIVTLGMMALVVVSAIVIGLNDPQPGIDVATSEPLALEHIAQTGFDIFSPPTVPGARPTLEPVRAQLRSKLPRPEVRTATYKPRSESRSSSRLRIRNFIPTTLVIYAENGVIKRRVEPWLYRAKSRTSS